MGTNTECHQAVRKRGKTVDFLFRIHLPPPVSAPVDRFKRRFDVTDGGLFHPTDPNRIVQMPHHQKKAASLETAWWQQWISLGLGDRSGTLTLGGNDQLTEPALQSRRLVGVNHLLGCGLV
jgi:hypothetical protein